MIIAIPSYKRAENCKTARLVDRAVIFVHEFEAEEYRKHNTNEVRTIPDELRGRGMATIRNYILENTEDKHVLMLDDDINYFGYYEKLILHKALGDQMYQFFDDMFRMTEEMGTGLWGLNLQSDKKFYREYSPFSLSSVVLGPCFGIIRDKDLRFDPRLELKEDYDYALQVLLKKRKVFRNNKWHYSADHVTKKGGCASYRNRDLEERQATLFQNKWGSKIVKIKRKTQNGNVSINPVVIAPISGI